MTGVHLRRLSVTMRAVEEALLAVETALAGPPYMVMTSYEDDIPHPMRPAIRELIQKLRREVQTVKDRYKLDPQTISNRRCPPQNSRFFRSISPKQPPLICEVSVKFPNTSSVRSTIESIR